MSGAEFTPHHISATKADLEGNQGRGRFVFLPGSDGRAKEISERFRDVRVCPSARAHNLYLGVLDTPSGPLDVASVASGMGTPSLDIIASELILLGCRVLLRVGTAGSLQPERVHVGDVVVATGAVRDDGASRNYAPLEFPAMAGLEMVEGSRRAGLRGPLSGRVHWGVVHSKDSLFAREFKAAPMAERHEEYMGHLRALGVLASEMEASHLFVLGQYYSQVLAQRGVSGGVLTGAILAIIGGEGPFAPPEQAKGAVERAIELAFSTMVELAGWQGAGGVGR